MSDNSLSNNAVSENSVSGNSVSGNTVSTNTVSQNTIGDEGWFYPGENPGCLITFLGKNHGTSKKITYVNMIPSGTTKTVEDFLGATCDEVIENLKDEGGKFVENPDKIVAWAVSVDGVYRYTIKPSELKSFTMNRTQDYLFTAKIQKQLADDIVINAMSGVYYCGKAHVVNGEKIKKKDIKKKINDIDLTIIDTENDKELVYGTDYTVKYKNNTEASMKMDDKNNGIFEQKYGEDKLSKRPYMIVTGVKNYKGFSAKVYFDIYPYNFGKQDPHVQISGIKNTFTINNGKISGWKEPKITLTFSGLKKKTLKAGRDYEAVIYKAGTGNWLMQISGGKPMAASQISEEGQYLYAVRGKGNYCGIFGGQVNLSVSFNPETPYPIICTTYTEDYAPWQFRVVNDAAVKFDLANAKVEVQHTTVNYNYNSFQYYTGDNAFGISVKYKDGNVWKQYPQSKYDLCFIGKDYNYIYGVDDKNRPVIRSNTNTDSSAMFAGEYKLVVKAAEGGETVGSYTYNKKIIVKGVNTNYKKLKKATIKYNGAPSTAADLEKAYSNKGLKVNIVADPRAALGNYYEKTKDSDGIYESKYLGSVVDFDKIDPKTVCPVNTVNDRMPGTYRNEFIAVGAGVDHGKTFVRKYKRVGIKLKEAEKAKNPEENWNLFYVAPLGEGKFNVSGAYPTNIDISFNGCTNHLPEMSYNGQRFRLEDAYHNSVTVRLWAYNNKKPGNKAYIVIQGDGKVFKGRSSKYPYNVVPREVSYNIDSLTSDMLYVDHGKKIPLTLKDSVGYAGIIYAKMSPGKKYKGKLPKKRDVKLYQAYYRNASDYAKNKKSLKKIDPKYYRLLFNYDMAYNRYSVAVKTGRVGGLKFNPDYYRLNEYYSLYDKNVKIKSIKIQAEDADYVLPDSKAVPALFTGTQIKPQVVFIKLSNGEVLYNDGKHYTVEYGSNVTAGKKKGSITIKMKQNTDDWNFKYGGSKTFYFNIGTHPGRTL
ncbi:MAG: hypothetical protein K6F34_07210 [Lachnospiraceae bacterium]|nr:hypothetical protein [Lachnospiraceae bacterium]